MSKKKYVNIEICQKTNVKTEIFKNSNMSKKKCQIEICQNRNISK